MSYLPLTGSDSSWEIRDLGTAIALLINSKASLLVTTTKGFPTRIRITLYERMSRVETNTIHFLSRCKKRIWRNLLIFFALSILFYKPTNIIVECLVLE